jgi:hypothetical protein
VGHAVNRHRVFTLLVKVGAGFLIGIVIAFFFIQRDQRFKHFVHAQVIEFFKRNYDSHFQGTLTKLNLINPTLSFDAITVTSVEGNDWSWQAGSGTLSFSWLAVLTSGKLAVHIALEDFKAHSQVINHKVALWNHLQKLFEPPRMAIPGFLKALRINRGTFRFNVPDYNKTITILTHCDMRRINHISKVSFYPTDGWIEVGEYRYITGISGSLLIEVALNKSIPTIRASSFLRCDLCQLDRYKTCFLEGNWSDSGGTFTCYNSDRSFVIEPLKINADKTFSCIVHTPFSFLTNFIPSLGKDWSGTCNLTCTGILEPSLALEGSVTFKKCSCPLVFLNTAHLTFKMEDKVWQGTASFVHPLVSFDATWLWNAITGGFIVVDNKNAWTIPGTYWQLPARGLSLTAQRDQQGGITANYVLHIVHKILETTRKSSGSLEYDLHKLIITGELKDVTDVKSYAVSAHFEPCFRLDHLTYRDATTGLVELKGSSTALEGYIHYRLLQSLLPDVLKEEVPGHGIVKVHGTVDDAQVKGTLSLSEGTIKLPKLYNFINALDASFMVDRHTKKVVITRAKAGLHRGMLMSQQATFFFNDAYHIVFAHVPITFDNCFVSWQKDLFALMSGHMLFTKKEDETQVQGFMIADRCQLKGNLFSRELQQTMLPHPQKPTDASKVNLNLHLMTRSPLQVRTSFLDAKAMSNLVIKRTLDAPDITGSIEVVSGELKFPYRPLVITTGRIRLGATSLYDPVVELTAKNKIKKYTVTLYVSGSLQNSRLRFEATPTLTEEQIIALLLTGAEESSLNILMPTLVVQNIQNIIFGPAQSTSTLQRTFKGLLKPLANVRIVPRLTDESARGGLRGALEIEVNDQLSGLIEKNFSLPEDTKFEVNYQLFDEMSIRGIKDERGDLGGEVEMRWKF